MSAGGAVLGSLAGFQTGAAKAMAHSPATARNEANFLIMFNSLSLRYPESALET
jgi:hypothetical protein